MIGILVELLISWLLLRWIEQRNLLALGIRPNRQRIKEFTIALLMAILIPTVIYGGISLLVHNPYRVNPAYSWKAFGGAMAYLCKAVVYEDLLFRGALLYILMHRIGPAKAVWLSAACFGIYHWFSYGVLGQPVQMVIVFLTTGMAGYVFALAFRKTGSMYVPFALHLGYDFAAMILFSKDKGIGTQLLMPTYVKDPVTPGILVSLITLLVYYTGFFVITLLYVRSLESSSSKHISHR